MFETTKVTKGIGYLLVWKEIFVRSSMYLGKYDK